MRSPLRTRWLPLGVVLAAALAGCGDDDGSSSATSSTSATTSTSTTSSTSATSSPSTTDAAASFPPALEEIEHGALTWAVVLAGSTDSEAPEVQTAIEVATDAGYDTGITDCDEGAADALGVDGGGTTVNTVSVYFKTERQAADALDAFQARGVDGAVVAQVRTFCADGA